MDYASPYDEVKWQLTDGSCIYFSEDKCEDRDRERLYMALSPDNTHQLEFVYTWGFRLFQGVCSVMYVYLFCYNGSNAMTPHI